MNRTAMVALIAMFAYGAPTAWAHEGHEHKIMGTVVARDAKHLEVKTPSGEVLSIALHDKTVVTRGKSRAAVTDVQTGGRVVVNIGNGEDPLIAKAIQLGATKLSGQ